MRKFLQNGAPESQSSALGTERCMLESNFQVDSLGTIYPVLWSTFKRIVDGVGKGTKTSFSG